MWRDGEGKRAAAPNHQIQGIVVEIAAKCTGREA
jgi:hypothetical protein